MANSASYAIAIAVKTLLTVPAMTAVAVADVHIEPIFVDDVSNGTALNLELGDENPAERITLGFKDRNVELKLTAIAAGSSAVANADAVIVEAHSRLMVDETLGGLCFDINEIGTNRENAANGKRLSIVEKTYSINYRTTEQSL